MVNEDNPLRSNRDLDESVVGQHYGADHDGPRPLSDAEGVVVEPVQISQNKDISDFVFDQVNVNKQSNQTGMDIYAEVLALVQKLEKYLWVHNILIFSTV